MTTISSVGSHKAYMESLGLGDLLIGRAEAVLSEIPHMLPLKQSILEVFICDLLDKDRRRAYTHLWVITEDYMCEAKDFLLRDDFDIVSRSRMTYANVTKTNMPGFVGTNDSQMRLEVNFGDTRIQGVFTATSSNCNNLIALYKRFVAEKVSN